MFAGFRGFHPACALSLLLPCLLCGTVSGQWAFTIQDRADGGATTSITSVDLNADAYRDAVVTDFGVGDSGGRLRLFLNQAGVLVPFATVSAGRSPIETLVADVDLDGGPDLVILEGREATQVLVRYGRGFGVFLPPISLGVLTGQPRDFDVADVTGDGAPDVIVAVRGSSQLTVFPSDGIGGFGAPTALLTSARAVSCFAVGDMDLDGIPDIALGHDGPAQIAVRRGTAGGAFALPIWLVNPVSAGLETTDLLLADLEGDEILDVVATFRIPGGVGTLVRKFDALVSAGYLRQTTIDPYPYRLAAEDLDGDGAPEILVAHHPAGGAGGLWTYPNTGRGWLEAPTRLLSAPGVIALHAQDFNADGVPDVLAASPGGRIRHAVNGTPQGGPLRGGTGEALDLAVGIGVGSTPTSAPGLDVRAVSAGETVNLSVRSWARTYNGTIPIVALELFPTAEPPSTGMIPGVWLNPVAAQVIGIGSPLTTPGATWTHVVPAGLVGASAMLQVFAGSPVALNGAWAATDAVELRFVL